MEEQALIRNFSIVRPSAPSPEITRPILETVLRRTEAYMKQHPKTSRKPYGQFFTGAETAVFMADLKVLTNAL